MAKIKVREVVMFSEEVGVTLHMVRHPNDKVDLFDVYFQSEAIARNFCFKNFGDAEIKVLRKFTPFAHQKEFADIWSEQNRMLNFSGCGVGKTGAVIHAVQKHWKDARVLVLGPLSILEPAWGGDLKAFSPAASYGVAYAKNRKQIFTIDKPQWVISNHDAIKVIVKEGWHKEFDILIVDEADAFRNRTSQRSKSLNMAAKHIDIITMMTGTPNPNSVTDLWHLVHCIDGGERLGKNFFGFRSQVQHGTPIPGAPPGAALWKDKPGAQDVVTSLINDIVYRVSLEDVTELPPLITRTITLKMPRKVSLQYNQMVYESMVAIADGKCTDAVNAGARMQKMLQILSGALYDASGEIHQLNDDRTNLVLDLVEETDASLVAFQWRHQRESLVAEAKKRKLDFAFIDGSVSSVKRERIVADYQAGKYQVLFAQPQSAGHGITLTRGNRVIWASPTYRADIYEQFNHRIYRTGQERKCEVIHVAYADSAELEVYEKLRAKSTNMQELLTTIVEMYEA